jgi:DNA recombination protein RmuC
MITLFLVLTTICITGLLAFVVHKHKLSPLLIEHAQLQTTLTAERAHHSEKLTLLETARQQVKHEFEVLAQTVLTAKKAELSEHHKTDLLPLLNPLREQIKTFEQKVSDVYMKESQDRHLLTHEIKQLKSLNERISQDAVNLTEALRGQNKVQGNWGEMILENILQKSGLQKDREYRLQVSLTSEAGQRYQPDAIIDLPENKHIIVDAKVSLTAYTRYHAAATEVEQAEYLKQHIVSIQGHIKLLSDKRYQLLIGLNSLDFVILFLPIEAALTTALQQDPSLFTDALEKNIVLVTPSSLFTTLRVIENMWRYEKQNKNAEAIAKSAGALYDKFVNFVGDLEKIGKNIEATQKSYEDAFKKLSTGNGNLIRSTEKIKELGAKTSKTLMIEADER